MGCVNCKAQKGRRYDPVTLASQTAFSYSDVEALAELFKSISSSIVADGKISKEEFKLAIFNNSEKEHLLADRIFDLFDVKKKGKIYFDDFIRSLNLFHPNTPLEAKIDFSFRLYDLNSNGFIERDEVKHMVITTLEEFELGVTNEGIETVLDKTFLDMDMNKDGHIDIEEWRSFVTQNPNIIKFMTIPTLREVTTYFPSFIWNTTVDDDQQTGTSNVGHVQPGCSTSTARGAQPGCSTSAARDAQPECSTSSARDAQPGGSTSTARDAQPGCSTSTVEHAQPECSTSSTRDAQPGCSTSTARDAQPGCSTSTARDAQPGCSTSTARDAQPECSTSSTCDAQLA